MVCPGIGVGWDDDPDCVELIDERVLLRVGLAGRETGRELGREEKLAE